MLENIEPNILFGLGGCALVALMAFFFFGELRRERDKHQEAVEEMEQMEEESFDLPEPIAKTARVMEKRFASDVIGTKSVKQVSSYYVTFFTEDGETVEYAVPREIFLQIEKGEERTLVTIGGQFFDYGDGEDLPKDDNESS